MARFLSKYKGLVIGNAPSKGNRIEFKNGEYVTENDKEAKFLRDYAAKHRTVTEDTSKVSQSGKEA